MKTIRQISDEFGKKLNSINVHVVNEPSEVFSFYSLISGFINEEYYLVQFMDFRDKEYRIEIAQNTKCTDEIISILKEIEPDLKITYSVTI